LANWAYLRSYSSQDDALADFVPSNTDAAGELQSKYSIPLFWLAAFDETCVLFTTSAEELAADPAAEYFQPTVS
jgi:hypothetical protein